MTAPSATQSELILALLRQHGHRIRLMKRLWASIFVLLLIMLSCILVSTSNLFPIWWIRIFFILNVLLFFGFVVFTLESKVRPSDWQETQRRLKQLAPDLVSDILSFEQLIAADSRSALFQEFDLRLSSSLSSLDEKRILQFNRYFRSIALGSTVMILLSLTSPGMKGWRTLLSSQTQFLEASEPFLSEINVELKYPSYAGLTDRKIINSSGTLRALSGTQVSIDAELTVNMKRAELYVVTKTHGTKKYRTHIKKLTGSSSPAKIHVEFPIIESASYFLVGDVGIRTLKDPIERSIDIEIDENPNVELLIADAQTEVSSSSQIEFSYEARDDFGVKSVYLVTQFTTSSGIPKVERKQIASSQSSAPPLKISSTASWDLRQADFKTGTLVTYFLEAEDFHSPPHVGRSQARTLKITDAREGEDELIRQLERLKNQLLQELAARLEIENTDATLPFKLAACHQQCIASTTMLDRITQDAPRSISAHTVNIIKELTKQQKSRATAEEISHSAWKKNPSVSLVQAAEHSISELEREIYFLDLFLGQRRANQMVSMMEEIRSKTDNLQKLLRSGEKNSATFTELLHQVTELEHRMQELAQKMKLSKSELPREFFNRESLLRHSMQDQLSKLHEAIEKKNLAQALEEFEKLKSGLEDLQKSLEKNLNSFKGQNFAEEEKLRESLQNEVRALMQQQQTLAPATKNLQDVQSSRENEYSRQTLEKFGQQMRKELAELQNDLEELERRNRLDDETQALAEQTVRQVKGAATLLERQEIQEAKVQLQEAEKIIDSLKKQQEIRQRERGESERLEPPVGQLREIQKRLQRLEADLNQLVARPDQVFSQEEQQNLKKLGHDQNDIGNKLQQMGQRLEQLSKGKKNSPVMNQLLQETKKRMEDARSFSQKAENSLAQSSPRNAVPEQKEVLKQLSDLQKSLDQKSQGEDRAGATSTQKIVLPRPDEHKVGEFRQPFLDAARGHARPKAYEDQVKGYYEELLK